MSSDFGFDYKRIINDLDSLWIEENSLAQVLGNISADLLWYQLRDTELIMSGVNRDQQ